MWSDNSHAQGFPPGYSFPHGPALDRLCQHSRLGCVLAGGARGGARVGVPTYMAQVQDPPTLPTATEISAEAAIFVAVIVVFYAAIIVILLGTNMRLPRSSSMHPRRSRSRTRSRSRHRHEVVLDARSGSVSTQHTHKKRDSMPPLVQGAERV
ncbi:uncharacterized protein [Procambarus clarkii]|uniref:uncharacterized protein n=1 Tax=Procambarus clarkii TaxID=6728 RepID=UPI001E673147|nr:uncharacterized protein LOC123768079 [Procambarus clarkii]